VAGRQTDGSPRSTPQAAKSQGGHTQTSSAHGWCVKSSSSSVPLSAPVNIQCAEGARPIGEQQRMGQYICPSTCSNGRAESSPSPHREAGNKYYSEPLHSSVRSTARNGCGPIIWLGLNSQDPRPDLGIWRAVATVTAGPSLHRTRDASFIECNKPLCATTAQHSSQGSVRLRYCGTRPQKEACGSSKTTAYRQAHNSNMRELTSRTLDRTPPWSIERPKRQDQPNGGTPRPSITCRSLQPYSGRTRPVRCRLLCDGEQCQTTQILDVIPIIQSRTSRLLQSTSRLKHNVLRVPSSRAVIPHISGSSRSTSASNCDRTGLPGTDLGTITFAHEQKDATTGTRSPGTVISKPRASPRPDLDSLPRGSTGQLLRAARAPSTWRKYDNQWAQFAGYCAAKRVSIEDPPLQTILDFLTEESKRMRTGRAVEAKRSALRKSAEVRGYKTDAYDAPLVRELVHGAIRTKPSLPRPPITFSGAAALRAVATTPTPPQMEIGKALFLTMLLGPWRLADALTMRVSLIDDIDGSLYCVLQPKEAKGRLEWRVLEPTANPNIDPVRHVRMLILRAKQLNSDIIWLKENGTPLTNQEARDEVQHYMLFIGLSPQWTPHSCRSAGASLMMLAGVSSPIIARHGGWQDMNNMWKFYCRTFAQDEVSQAVERFVFVKTSTASSDSCVHSSMECQTTKRSESVEVSPETLVLPHPLLTSSDNRSPEVRSYHDKDDLSS